MSYKKYRVLLVDDELGWCKVNKSGYQENDFEVECEVKAENTLNIISSFDTHAVLLDVRLNNINNIKEVKRF